MTNQKTTAREIKWAAYAAILTMLTIMAAGIKELLTEPRTITSREIVMMPNDSLIALQRENATLQADNRSLRLVADTRAQILSNLTGPMKGITDSMLALQRMSRAGIQENKEMLHSQEASRERRVEELKDFIVATNSDRPDVASLLHQQTNALTGLIRNKDTVFIRGDQESRKFWERVKAVFKRQK